jgi:hypothetical protein
LFGVKSEGLVQDEYLRSDGVGRDFKKIDAEDFHIPLF